MEQSRGYDLAHRLCDSCWGPELSQSAVCVCTRAIVQAGEKKRDTADANERARVCECLSACVCVCLCVTVPEAERNMAHRRASRGLSQEGRQPRPLALLPLAENTHTHTRKLRDGEACRPAHVFSVTAFIHFPSVRFILHGV